MTASRESSPQTPSSDSSPSSLLPRLARYRQPNGWRSLWQLVSTMVGFVLLWLLAWWSLRITYGLTLLVAVPAAAFLVRLFILAHDCGHGSLFGSRRVNDLLGFWLGVLTLTPYHHWRKQHAMHHATSGDLDRRGVGDVLMLTVREYQKLPAFDRWRYRVQRHPLMLFGIGPFLYFVLWQRLVTDPPTWKKERRSVHFTNLALLALTLGMSWLVGWRSLLAVHVPIVAMASSAGVWLFYVQHHFEATYWRRQDQWDYVDAGLQGSSYYALPRPLQWVTASIGLHHIHHLDSHIPNYRLQECLDENPQFQQFGRMTLRESLRCARLKLWDEDAARMVGFDAVR